MTRPLHYLFTALSAVLIGLLCGCSQNSTEGETLSREEAEQIAIRRVFFDRDGLHLRLTEEEATEMGISKADYVHFVETIREGDKMWRAALDSAGPDGRVAVSFPLSQVDTTGMDRRYVFVDAEGNVLIDRQRHDE